MNKKKGQLLARASSRIQSGVVIVSRSMIFNASEYLF